MKGNEMKHNEVIMYFVNGEMCETADHKLTPKQILENAGFVPVESYRLIRDDGSKELADYYKEEPIHKDETFTALFNGATPVSEV